VFSISLAGPENLTPARGGVAEKGEHESLEGRGQYAVRAGIDVEGELHETLRVT